MPYKEPTGFIETDDKILTNYDQEVELHEREIDGEPNPRFTRDRNANSRIWLKNGKRVRILVEVDGVVDKDNPLAVGFAVCGPLEKQPFYVRFRAEPPGIPPTDPALEVSP